MLKNCFENLFIFSQQFLKNYYKINYEMLIIKRPCFNSNIIHKEHWGGYHHINDVHLHFLKYKFSFILNNRISTKRRRYFKIRKHQKKKYKKKRMGLSTIPWIPTKEKIRTYKLPRQSKLINKRFMRDNKGGRRYRLKKQR
ncbi:hypothetical protein MKS88_005571 [Plasmodium brasilianum]|uniref:Uncharacterized protein n=2 Tax=Plasmodium (Plasmodium) TaxID=418103 RepID=A0A1D3TEU7_PLAMA|nr:conserved Plasmodium protein, unknown function [Plasmodium malariae]KAI4834892.1 hypothetical protein MKS88_005571 [Plasmodium brasilianum]SCP03459.1 conserved Plasmodium protein, unknown function [Plasmodium malariae]